ncbi:MULTISPECIES: hypothetical protein [Streptomyces]
MTIHRPKWLKRRGPSPEQDVDRLLAAVTSVEPAETDEERAGREETERDHAKGDHTYCGVTCEAEVATEMLRNFVIARGYPGTAGALDELLRRARTEAAAPSAPADRDLREIVAGAIYGCRYPDDDWGEQRGGIRSVYLGHADAVLAVLPAPADLQVWPLARVLAEVRCGSRDWTWEEEWADLDRRHAETGYLAKLEQEISKNGITLPVLIGSDGRLWDGHHRLRIAVRRGIDYVPVEITPSRLADEAQQPGATHIYLSTGCHHGDEPFAHGLTGHEYCQSKTGVLGSKKPAQCKGETCHARCVCACHTATEAGRG